MKPADRHDLQAMAGLMLLAVVIALGIYVASAWAHAWRHETREVPTWVR